jgi:hypothetical protein
VLYCLGRAAAAALKLPLLPCLLQQRQRQQQMHYCQYLKALTVLLLLG